MRDEFSPAVAKLRRIDCRCIEEARNEELLCCCHVVDEPVICRAEVAYGLLFRMFMQQHIRGLLAVEGMAGQQIEVTAVLAFVGAITAVVMIFVGKPGWGILLAVCAAVLGAVGFLLQASPPVRGGVIRIFAIIIAIFGIGLSVLG